MALRRGRPIGQNSVLLLGNIIPPGTITSFSGPNVPDGWLLCDGSEISRTQYSALYEAIQDIYGAGDGEETFNLPDGRGVFMRGLDEDRGLDAGRSLGSYQADEFKSHQHQTNVVTGNAPLHNVWGSGPNMTGQSGTSNNLPSGMTNWTGGTETRPKNLATRFIIKY